MSSSNQKTNPHTGPEQDYVFKDCTDEMLKIVIDPPKPKLTPWKPTVFEKSVLEGIYHLKEKPTIALRDEIANQLGVSKKSIRIWFMNRSAKKSKQMEPTNIEKAVKNDTAFLKRIEQFLLKFDKKDKEIKDFLRNNISFDSLPSKNRKDDVPFSFYEIFSPKNDFTDDDLFF